MKLFLTLTFIALTVGPASTAGSETRKSVLDNNPDLFTLVTPDHLLGNTPRRKWLDLYPVNAKEYWAAWDCKGKRCDTKARARIRATCKLVPRTARDPKPIDEADSSGVSSGG